MSSDVEKVCALLRQAEEQGVKQAFQCYTEDDNCMCATAAVYKAATGVAPIWWDELAFTQRSETILRQLEEATGVDFIRGIGNGDYPSLFYRIINLNDRMHLSFGKIAQRLEEENNE